MDPATHKRRTASLLRWSPAFLTAACTLLLESLRFESISLRYCIPSAFLGFLLGLVIVLCWRLEKRSRLNFYIVVLVVMSWRSAQEILQKWAFHGADLSWSLDVQGVAANFIGLFALLSTFRRRIHKFVFEDAEQLVGGELNE